MNSSSRNHRPGVHVSVVEWFLACIAGLAASCFVWWPLWTGGGLVGGDTYPYFLPQKQIMAESFARGELPLWHDRTGLGYPLLAESQAGVFYPPNQVLYRLMNINQAYSLSIALHYWLAFVLAWRFARTQHVSCGSALLAAVVFVYGWFPARISLEWSIVGGVWLPASLWLTDRWLHCRSRRHAVLLAGVFAMHLLAGHFTLAFITQLTCCLYAVLKTWFRPDVQTAADRAMQSARAVAGIAGCVLLGLSLSAVQLVPTLELKSLSQRQSDHVAFDPAYGHLPPVYLTQLVASWWYWHTPEMVLSRQMTQNSFLSHSAATNQVEAHLYFGLIPLALMLLLLNRVIRARLTGRALTIWMVLLVLSILYATGWLMPVTRHLPGFGFFMGPGRYTIVAALSAGILSGLALDAILRYRSYPVRLAMILSIAVVTMADVLKSSEYPVRDAMVLETAPFSGLATSWVRSFVAEHHEGDLRLLAPGPNVADLYGVSSVPQYLGLGPAEYYADQASWRVRPDDDDQEAFPTADEQQKLMDHGVTHLLATDRIVRPSDALRLVFAGPDSFLNRVWGRGQSPVYLYEFVRPPSRVVAVPSVALSQWSWMSRTPNDLSFSVSLDAPADVILKELMYPGWRVTVDGQLAVPLTADGFERRVRAGEGQHIIRWTYQPGSFWLGTAVSGAALVLCLLLLWRTALRSEHTQPGQKEQSS